MNKTFKTVIVTVLVTVAVILTSEYYLGFSIVSLKSYSEKKLDYIEKLLSDNYYEDVDQDKIIESAITSMVDAVGDRYTRYLNAQEWNSLNNSIKGVYDGFGLGVTLEENKVYIDTIYENSSAEKEGVKVNDIIKKVDDIEITDAKKYAEVSKKFISDDYTKVKLVIYRESEKKEYEFELVKGEITVKNLFAKKLKGNIAYIKMNVFDEKCDREFKENADRLIEQGCTSLIVDLRNNPGGYYEKAIKIADYLLPDCLISYTIDKKGNKEERYSDDEYKDIPLVVLVNENSASASEVLSGAIKGNKRGVLVGENTFGKGLVQRSYEFSDNTGVNITIARYYIPTGECIHGKGIAPDFEVALPKNIEYSDNLKLSKDTQLQKAMEIAVNKAGE